MTGDAVAAAAAEWRQGLATIEELDRPTAKEVRDRLHLVLTNDHG